jgi:hypothetical protein
MVSKKKSKKLFRFLLPAFIDDKSRTIELPSPRSYLSLLHEFLACRGVAVRTAG